MLAYRVNVEYFLLQYLAQQLNLQVIQVRRRLETDLHDIVVNRDLPVLWIRRTGGRDDGAGLDQATVTVQVYASDDLTAWQKSEDVRVAMLGLDGASFMDGCFGEVRTHQAPVQLPYTDPVIALYSAEYRLDVRAV